MRFNHAPVSVINSRNVEMTSKRYTDPLARPTLRGLSYAQHKSGCTDWWQPIGGSLFPGEAFDINERPGRSGRSAGSASWAGLLNCYFWRDPVKKVTGALFTQILPSFDARVVSLYGKFERGLYRGLERT
jgi:hypothetical protein